MIRRAAFPDIPAILGLVLEMHRCSSYAGLDEVDQDHVKALLVQSIQRHGAPGEGGTLVMVAETDGVVTGFVIGMRERLYHIGTKLMASDLMTYNSPSGSAGDGLRLFDALVAWSEASPNVVEIKVGAVDAIGGTGSHERTAKMFARRGLEKVGAIYQRSIER